MTAKDYTAAIASYTSAVQLDPTNPVYYSNRAAAHSSVEDHYSAIEDAEKALELDPKFAKAYSRMGHAYFCLEQYDEAKKSFEKGLALDPTNSNLKTGAESARAKLASTASTTSTPATARSPAPSTGGAAGGAGGMPDLSALLAGMGGGGGGMPDLASIMNNPMMMQAAQQMMANGGLEAMMQDPSIRSMVRRIPMKSPLLELIACAGRTFTVGRRNALNGRTDVRPNGPRYVSTPGCVSFACF